MKFWRGYLVAAILLVCSWALEQFAKAHTTLVDMIYPYVSRMSQNFLAEWCADVPFCLWQALLLAAAGLVVAIVVLVVVFKWNPVRWLGWISAGVAAVILLNTVLFGLNQYSGPLSEDIRLEQTVPTINELESAAIYYRDQANTLSQQVQRDMSGDVAFDSFETLAQQAVEGFETLVYDRSLSVFAGSMVPVKKLGWEKYFTARGITGVTVGLTGEAAVNPGTPAVLQPFAMCMEMAHRTSIAAEADAGFAAYMACLNNTDLQFQYSGALMGYRYCLKALEALDSVTGNGAAARVAAEESDGLQQDLRRCDEFYGDGESAESEVYNLLASWHIQEIVLPSLVEEEDVFDPMDKSQVDLSDHPDA